MPLAMREDPRIIHRTADVPRSLLLLRGDLPGLVKARLKKILLAAPDKPEGRGVLDAYRGVTRYDLLEGAAAIEVAAARQIGGGLR